MMVPGVAAASGDDHEDDDDDGRERPFRIPGVSTSVGVGDDFTFEGLSDELVLRASVDPAHPGQGGGRGRRRRRGEGVIHITSIPDDHDSHDTATRDYAFSIVNLQQEDITVNDVVNYDGDGAAFSHEWFVTENDVTEAGTDNELVGRGPGEFFLILQDPQGQNGSDLVSNIPTLLFRSMYVGRGRNEWNTRDVADELTAADGNPWQQLQVRATTPAIVDLGGSVADAFGDYEILAAGVGRGGLIRGPSILDTYYRNFMLLGEEFPFPVTVAASDVDLRGFGNDD